MPRDKILLKGMIFYGFHGNSAAEQELGQRFVVDMEIHRDLHAAGLSDDPEDTVNYSRIFRLVKEIVEDHWGTVSAYPDPDGKGTIFAIELPLGGEPSEIHIP